MKLTIDVNTTKLLEKLTDELVDTEGLIHELTLTGEAECKKEAPKDTGELMRSITSQLQGKSGIVKTNIKYARYVIYGTSSHKIRVKNKKVLSDINSPSTHKQNAIYGTEVTHPGTKPNNFPARALNNIRHKLPRIAKKYILK